MIDSEAREHVQPFGTPQPAIEKLRESEDGQAQPSLQRPLPAHESELGSRLAEILAHPDRSTLGAYAAVLDQIRAELSLLQPMGGAEPQSAAFVGLTDGDEFAALFEHERIATPFSAHDIDALAASLLSHTAPGRMP